MHCHQFCVGRAGGIQLLLGAVPVHHSFPESHERARVTLHVLMNSEHTIDEPSALADLVSLKCQSYEFGSSQVSDDPA